MDTADQVKPRLYSIPNAARVLDVSRSALYAALKIGRIKFVYVGADRRIPAEEVDRIASQGLPK